MESVMKNASFLDTVKTVVFGFIGVRRKSDHEAARIKPAHVVILGIILAALFVLTLRTIVGIVTS
jgi:hypothetical protein